MMNLAQSPHIPADGNRPRLKDTPWLLRYSARGLWELVRARITFATLEAKAIPVRNRAAKEAAAGPQMVDEAMLARISYVLPRLSDRLLWRSDCLVQAIAAQNWLSAHGAASEIQIGVENPKDGKFGAHAWLMHKGSVVTGGNIDQYHVILSESPVGPDSLDDSSTEKPDAGS